MTQLADGRTRTGDRPRRRPRKAPPVDRTSRRTSLRGRHGPGHAAGRRGARAARRLIPPGRDGAAVRLRARPAARHGGEAGRRSWPASSAAVAAGQSELEPGKKDRRFADPAWTGNPLLRRAMQAHLAAGRTAVGADRGRRPRLAGRRADPLHRDQLVDAPAPSNLPVLNPLSLKAAIDTGGGSALTGSGGCSATWPPRRGCRRWSSRTRSPSATTSRHPGRRVFRTDVFELIQYRPTTETVRAVPLLMVPPTINKFYVADLAPGRSIVEHYLIARASRCS